MTDTEWLENKIGRTATDEEIEAFCERVSIMIYDGGLDENKARELAVNEVKK